MLPIRAAFIAMFMFVLTGCMDNTGAPATNTRPGSAVERTNFIYVSGSSPASEASALGRLDRARVEQRIARQRAQPQSLRAKNGPQTVAYVLYGDIPVGARIVTSYTYSRATDSIGSEPTDRPFTEQFQYVVVANTPIQPIVIVNELNSVFKGTFVLEATVNGRSVVRKVVPVTNDLPGLRRN